VFSFRVKEEAEEGEKAGGGSPSVRVKRGFLVFQTSKTLYSAFEKKKKSPKLQVAIEVLASTDAASASMC
jgi:hypothetical protein